MTEKKDEKSELIRQVGLLTVIPILLAVGPLVGMLIGNLLDGWLGTEPYLMWVFIVLGFVAAGQETYKLIKKVSKD
ncbi:MAG: AtpZ/AtpI family protein [candidate division Zixibacteria bacterium]|nr:AtpZ/AtpI family protein [candidate division Zixibacteria bacterium]